MVIKGDESNWRKQIKLMMIQMHNERSNAIGLDWDLSLFGGSWSGKEEENGKNDKRKPKIKYFHFA